MDFDDPAPDVPMTGDAGVESGVESDVESDVEPDVRKKVKTKLRKDGENKLSSTMSAKSAAKIKEITQNAEIRKILYEKLPNSKGSLDRSQNDILLLDIVKILSSGDLMTIDEAVEQAIKPNFYELIKSISDKRIEDNPDEDHYALLNEILAEYMKNFRDLTPEEKELFAKYILTINEGDSVFENNASNLKIMYLLRVLKRSTPEFESIEPLLYINDEIFELYLSLIVGSEKFEAGDIDVKEVKQAVEQVSTFMSLVEKKDVDEQDVTIDKTKKYLDALIKTQIIHKQTISAVNATFQNPEPLQPMQFEQFADLTMLVTDPEYITNITKNLNIGTELIEQLRANKFWSKGEEEGILYSRDKEEEERHSSIRDKDDDDADTPLTKPDETIEDSQPDYLPPPEKENIGESEAMELLTDPSVSVIPQLKESDVKSDIKSHPEMEVTTGPSVSVNPKSATPFDASASTEIGSTHSPQLDDSFVLMVKQWQLLSAKMTIILGECEKKFTRGRDFISLYLSKSKVLIHSDILDKLTMGLSIINKSYEEAASSAEPIQTQGKKVAQTQGEKVVEKYKASLAFVEQLRRRFDELNSIYTEALAKGEREKVNWCIQMISELLQLAAALYSPIHLTNFAIDSDEENNMAIMSFTSLPSTPKKSNYEWLKTMLSQGVGGSKIVSGVTAIASILDEYAVNISLLTEDNATPLLSLTCASRIQSKLDVLNLAFKNSKTKDGDEESGDEEGGDEEGGDKKSKPKGESPQNICKSFEKLFFEDGKLGEYLQICLLSILKFTTLVQKTGDSHMPIQVGAENLMKKTSKALDCFMDVYNFVTWWCNNSEKIKQSINGSGILETWVDNVAKELLSLLFKFIQFYGGNFMVYGFAYSEGKKNLCKAPSAPANDRDPNSLEDEKAQKFEQVRIPLYENPDPGITSYDMCAKKLNDGFNGDSYSTNLDKVNALINENSALKKELRERIKLESSGELKGGMPKKKGDPQLSAKDQLSQIETMEKFKKKWAGLKDDADNFMPVSPPRPTAPQRSQRASVFQEPPPPDVLPWDTFKKYLENYIVNFCHEGQPSLKMVTFLKMMHLNALMVRLGWGFIDLAGGSLMNFLKRRFVVTADYDNKIYFIKEGITEEELIRRQTYIKMCMINMGIEINNYMVENDFFGGAKIKAQFSFKHPTMAQPIPLDLITVSLEPIPARPFGSRGKEPELFPVPLFSSDMFLNVKLLWVNRRADRLQEVIRLFQELGELYAANLRSPTDDLRGRIAVLERQITELLKMFKSDGFTMSIGYEDLVFKTLDKHFLYKRLKELGNSHEAAMQIIFSTFVSPYNFDPNDPTLSKMRGSRWFALRIPSLYEIEYDILSMLTEPELKNARMAVGKSGKDVTRKDVVDALKRLLIDKENNKRAQRGEPPLVTDQEKENFFTRYPIASTFVDKILLYFQTDLFQICCKRVKQEDVKMRNAMILPPLGVIPNGSNDMTDDQKNRFLPPPVYITLAPAVVLPKKKGKQTKISQLAKKNEEGQLSEQLELTQVMRRAVLYSSNTVSKIFMTQICLTKKYGEFKSVADFERARHFLEINFTALSNGEISFDLFNYELWISRGKLQSPIPFKNCYVATFGRPSNSLLFSNTKYQEKLGTELQDIASPRFMQLVEGVQPPSRAAPMLNPGTGVVDGTPVTEDNIQIKNTTAEIIASKLELSKLKPLYGVQGGNLLDAVQISIAKATDTTPTEASHSTVAPLSTAARARSRGLVRAAPAINDFTTRLIGEPQAVFAGGGNKHRPTLTRKRSSQSSSSLLLFTKRNRHPNHQSLKQKKRTIKKGSRKKRHNEMKKKKSIKKRV